MLKINRLCLSKLKRICLKRNIFLSTSRKQTDFGFTSFDRRLGATVGYIVTLPEIPEQSFENNQFLSNITRNEDWPPLKTALPAEFFEGTIQLLMDFGVTNHDHYQRIIEEAKKDRFRRYELRFEQMLEPLLAEEYDVDYAYNTLLLKMYTDWPECSSNDWKCDVYDVLNLRAQENRNKLTYSALLYQWTKSVLEECKKLKEKTKEKGEIIESLEDADKDLDTLIPYWQRKLIEYYHRHFISSGLAIYHDGTRKHQLRLSKVNQFTNISKFDYIYNIMVENREPIYRITDRSALKGAPPHVLRELAIDKNAFEEGNWEVTLTPQKMGPFMRYCADRRLRTYAWNKWVTVAGFISDSMSFCNGVPISRSVIHSYVYAKNLGYKNPAEFRFSNSMAGSADAVSLTIDLMYRRFFPTFKSRYQNWVDYGQSYEVISGALTEKDLFYVSRKEAEHHYKVDFLNLMHHFPFWPTFEKILQILSYLFNLKFEDVTDDSKMERCHETCKIFSVTDQTNVDNPMRRLDKLVYLIGAANEPDNDGNSYLHYEQLEALLFQLGRSLQLLLSESSYREIVIPWEPQYYAWGGRHLWKDEFAMDWDAVNMFPEFLRFFVYKPSLLSQMSSQHAITDMELTEAKAEPYASALQRGSFWEAYRCLFFSEFDLNVFTLDKFNERYWQDIYKEKYEKYFPFKFPDKEYPAYQATNFAPIFSNPVFFCKYYRKLWTEMLALDIHETFGLEKDETQTGERFKNTILKKGAGEQQSELYMRFIGRDPSIGAILDFYTNPILSLSTEETKKLQSGYS